MSMPAVFLASALAALPAVTTAGPEGLMSLKEGEVRHGFTARALFTGYDGSPLGARFVHRTGVQLDLLFFPSVPQASILFHTLPVSQEGGEPHTLEHLVLGQGRTGKLLGTLQAMRLATDAAGTYRDATVYQLRSPIGRSGFRELLTHFLEALARPDFTDEEARREVANLEVAEGAQGLALVEKGTVYNEQVASETKPGWHLWRLVDTMVFGSAHPLASDSGGTPAGLRELTPEAIRRFHARNYRIGPGLEMIVSLPLAWSADEFLGELDAAFVGLVLDEPSSSPGAVPPFQPAAPGEIRIGVYPAESAEAPQDVVLAWPVLPDLTPEEWAGLELLLDVVGGGEASYLYRDLVDQQRRSVDSGASGVWAGVTDRVAPTAYAGLDGLPASSLDRERLARIRDAVQARFRWIAGLKEGSPALSEVAEKARARVATARRRQLKLLASSPQFGDRAQRRWHTQLARAVRAPGFAKPLGPFAFYDRLEKELAAGRNPWTALVSRAGLAEPAYVAAMRPDPALVDRDKAEAATRLERHRREIAQRLGGGDEQKGLAALRLEYDARTRALEERDRTIPKPAFVSDPPLTLDDAPYEQALLDGGVPVVRVHFETTPFTDMAVAFDLSGLSEDERMLLPLLAEALSGTGVTTGAGEALDYVQARERWQTEIHDFSIATLANPSTRRYELEVRASASSTEEIRRALDWMENHMLRPRIREARARLVDVCKRSIQSHRATFDSYENRWAPRLAFVIERRHDPMYMFMENPFTRLRLLTRLRWRLEQLPADAREQLEGTLTAVEGRLRSPADRASVAAALEGLEGEVGETLRYELALLPPDRWREDLSEVIADLRIDLATEPASVLEALDRLRGRLFVRGRARTRITASRAHADQASKLLAGLLASLPEGRPAPEEPPATSFVQTRLHQRYGKIPRLVHAGLIRPGAATVVHTLAAPGPTYASRSREAALEALALGIFRGTGPHSFFKQAWSAGLAYSSGLQLWAMHGRLFYYADGCPDPARILEFLAGRAAGQPIEDPFLLQYSLSTAFGDYRGADDFSSRGAALAADLADGVTPEQVAGFKRLLLETARQPDALARVRERLPEAVGRVLVGYGPKVSDTPGASALVIGPEEMLARYEAFLKEKGEADRLIRVYPRDFWPLSEAAKAAAPKGDQASRPN